MGNFELRIILSVVRRLCGQLSIEPIEVVDQLYSRMSWPISPPPDRKGGTLVWLPRAGDFINRLKEIIKKDTVLIISKKKFKAVLHFL